MQLNFVNLMPFSLSAVDFEFIYRVWTWSKHFFSGLQYPITPYKFQYLFVGHFEICRHFIVSCPEKSSKIDFQRDRTTFENKVRFRLNFVDTLYTCQKILSLLLCYYQSGAPFWMLKPDYFFVLRKTQMLRIKSDNFYNMFNFFKIKT